MRRRTCCWLVRWYHRAKRNMDKETLIDTMIRMLDYQGIDTPENRQKVIMEFLRRRGQEHWWCPCARHDRRHLVRYLYAPHSRPLF